MTDDRPPPSRRKSRLLLLVAGFFFFVPPVVVGIAIYRSFDRPPEIAVDLPQDPDARRAAFRARVEAAFPPGSPETRLVETMKEQGFHIATVEAADWPRKATIIVERWTCTTTYEIKWRNDAAGSIAAVDPDVRAPCP